MSMVCLVVDRRTWVDLLFASNLRVTIFEADSDKPLTGSVLADSSEKVRHGTRAWRVTKSVNVFSFFLEIQFIQLPN